MTLKNFRIPRRSFLRGTGVSILLPYLDIMVPSVAHAQGFTPKRFAAINLNGSIYGAGIDLTKNNQDRYNNAKATDPQGMRAWLPAVGALPTTLPTILAQLSAHRAKISLISGMSSMPGNLDTNQHSLALAAWLTAGWDNTAEANSNWPGTANRKSSSPPDSLDQAIAKQMGLTSTIVFNGTTSGTQSGGAESNGGYLAAISFNSNLGGSRIVPKSSNPQTMFNSLFDSCTVTSGPTSTLTQGQTNQGKVLDRVIGSINDLKPKLGQEDKHRLDNYLTFISELQDRILEPPPPPADWCPEDLPTLNESWYNRVCLMIDVIAYALATDTKPVATLLPASEPTSNNLILTDQVAKIGGYVGIGGQVVGTVTNSSSLHTGIIHKSQRTRSGDYGVPYIESYIAYNRMQMTLVKRLVDKMESFPNDPNGKKPLDNSLVYVGSCHSHGNTHNVRNLPAMLIGGSELGFKKGQHIQLPQDTDIGHFYYSIMKKMGFSNTSFNGHSNYLTSLFT